MRLTWKKYLIFTVVLSAILGVIIPELIDYSVWYEWNYSSSNDTQSGGIDINLYGLIGKLFIRTLYWFVVSFFSLIFLGLVLSFIKKSFSEQKQIKGV